MPASLLLLTLALLSIACGSDSGGNDAGPPIDARFLSDARVQSCSEETNSCPELAFTRRCDLERSRCVECTDPADCGQQPSLGPVCDTESGTCQCASDQDCVENSLGSYCHPTVKACGCITDDECAGNRQCKLEPYLGTGIRTCQDIPA